MNRARIDDANGRIHARWPHSDFVWADVRNPHDNPNAATPAADYRFPFADASFDVIYAASLFTHLLPDEARNYLSEARRVLRPGGRCLFSFFILDQYRGPGTTSSRWCEFEHSLSGAQGVAIHDPEYPSAVVAYSLRLVKALDLRRLGLDAAALGPKGLISPAASFRRPALPGFAKQPSQSVDREVTGRNSFEVRTSWAVLGRASKEPHGRRSVIQLPSGLSSF